MAAGILGGAVAWGIGFYVAALVFRWGVLAPPGFDTELTPAAVARRAWAADPTLDQALAMPEWRAALHAFSAEWRLPLSAPEIASLGVRLGVLAIVLLVLMIPCASLLEHAARSAIRSRVDEPATPRFDARDAFAGLARRAFVPLMFLAGVCACPVLTLFPYNWHAFDLSHGPPLSGVALGAGTGAILGAILGAATIGSRLLAPTPDRSPFCPRCGYRLEHAGQPCPECGFPANGPSARDEMRVMGTVAVAARRPARTALLCLLPLIGLALLAVANAAAIAATGHGVGALARFDLLARPGVEMPGLIVPAGASLAIESDSFDGVVSLGGRFPPGTLTFSPRAGHPTVVTLGNEDRGHLELRPGLEVGAERRAGGVVLWFAGAIHAARFISPTR